MKSGKLQGKAWSTAMAGRYAEIVVGLANLLLLTVRRTQGVGGKDRIRCCKRAMGDIVIEPTVTMYTALMPPWMSRQDVKMLGGFPASGPTPMPD